MNTLPDLTRLATETKWRKSPNQERMHRQMMSISQAVGPGPITQEYVDLVVAHLADRYSNPSSARRVGNVFRSVVLLGQRYNHIPPHIVVDLPHTRAARRRSFTPNELARLDTHMYGSLVYWCLRDLGLRGVGRELLNLKFSDVDWGAGRVKVVSHKGQGTTIRHIPMSEKIRAEFSNQRYQRAPDPDDAIVQPKEVELFKDRWSTAPKPDDATPYQLRHTYATRLLQKNVPPHVVQHIMGHSDIKTTMSYAHITDQDLDNVSNIL